MAPAMFACYSLLRTKNARTKQHKSKIITSLQATRKKMKIKKTSEWMIEAHDLHRSYGSKEAVSGIAFQVQRGEIFGLLGPNGAGKTTTIRMLTGQIDPSSGQASVAGY